MGTWGTGLYADDTALDLRDDWTTGIRWGRQPELLTKTIVADLTEDDTAAWLALADLQWKSGHLLPHVRDKALAIINGGSDLERWKDAGPGDQRSRRKVLAGLQARLLTTPPPPRGYKHRREADTTMKIGEVYAWQLLDGRHAFFQVAGIETQPKLGVGRAPAIRVLDRVSHDIPPLAALADLPSRGTIKSFEGMEGIEPTFRVHPLTSFAIFGPCQYPKQRLTRLGRMPLPSVLDGEQKALGATWLSADLVLADVYGIGWWVGDMVAWRLNGQRPVVLSIAAVGTVEHEGRSEPYVTLDVMDWSRPDLPTGAELCELVPLTVPDQVRGGELTVLGLPPAGRLEYLGRVDREEGKTPRSYLSWEGSIGSWA